jgi:hypothetical protein
VTIGTRGAASPWSGANLGRVVGTGDKVLVAYFIIAINRRISVTLGSEPGPGLCPFWTAARIWLYL